MTEACDLPAVEARRLIGQKRLSPVELAESCIARVEAVDHAVNALVARDFARARGAAREAEAKVTRGEVLGALHGLPLGIKDLENTERLRTTYGSVMFRDHVPREDQGMVAALKWAGGIVLGKTNTPEFGAGANTRNKVYGATGNPFDPAKSAAGSSGGSAVALATGMVPLASGSDMGGSLRNPAAFCGIVGMRPSPGLVPSELRLLGWSSLSVLGPMARNVPDLALMLSAMAGDDARDPLAYTVQGRQVWRDGDFYPVKPVDLASLRVAASADFGFAPTEAGIASAFNERLARLDGLFGALEAASPDCRGADEAFAVKRAVAFLASFGATYKVSPEKLSANIRANVEEGLRYSAEDVARAEAAHTAYYRRWQAFFERFDIIITPAITITPRSWTELYPTEIDGKPTKSYFHWLALAYAVTLAGHPALSLPLGRDAAGMPFGLQIIGPRGGDALVLRVAAALEKHFAGDAELCRPRPDLKALETAPPISGMTGFLD
jgi:amidase